MTFACYEEAFPGRFFWLQNADILSDKAPAYLLPFWNLLVAMKPQSLELHSIENRAGLVVASKDSRFMVLGSRVGNS
jgi:hypothetical protein